MGRAERERSRKRSRKGSRDGSRKRKRSEEAQKQTTRDVYRQLIEAVYRRWNTEKVGDVPSLMEKYEGQEDEIYDKIVRKYVFCEGNGKCDWLPLIEAMYDRFNASKLDELDRILEKYLDSEAALYKALCDKYIPVLKPGDAPMRTDAWATSRAASSEPEPDSPEEEPEPKAPSASAAATPALASVKQEVPEPEAEAEGSAAAAVMQELPPKKRRKHRHPAAGAGEEAGGLQAVKAEDAPATGTAAAPAQDQLRRTKQSAQDAGRKAKHAEAPQAPLAAARAAGEPEGGAEGPGEAPPRRKKRRRTAAEVPESAAGTASGADAGAAPSGGADGREEAEEAERQRAEREALLREKLLQARKLRAAVASKGAPPGAAGKAAQSPFSWGTPSASSAAPSPFAVREAPAAGRATIAPLMGPPGNFGAPAEGAGDAAEKVRLRGALEAELRAKALSMLRGVKPGGPAEATQ